MPRCTSGYPISARSWARIRSHAVARPAPPPSAPTRHDRYDRSGVSAHLAEDGGETASVDQVFCLTLATRAFELLEIGSRAEVRAGAADCDDVDRRIGRSTGESLDEVLDQRRVERVPLRGPV